MKTGWIIIALLVGAVGCRTPMQFSRPDDGGLQRRIATADRIVVRDGGQVCCTKPEDMLKQPVYFTITNRTEIADVAGRMTFEPTLKYNPCACCGHPGIDWFRGQKRLAITTWKHGYGILMEDGFVGILTPESKKWLREWLLSHGLTEDQIK